MSFIYKGEVGPFVSLKTPLVILEDIPRCIEISASLFSQVQIGAVSCSCSTTSMMYFIPAKETVKRLILILRHYFLMLLRVPAKIGDTETVPDAEAVNWRRRWMMRGPG
jgi:hypothetical protein